MTELKATAFSSLTSNLVNRTVTFAPAKPAISTTPQIYGIYTVLPQNGLVVVKADLRLLASLGGALIGLPDGAVPQHIQGTSLSETLKDAVHEILNITSKIVTTSGRAVLKTVTTDPKTLDPAFELTLKKAQQRSYFSVSVQDYSGGMFSVFGADETELH